MTFLPGGNTGAGGPGSGLRFATTRGRMQGTLTGGMNYPSPFFDLAHTWLPTTIKDLLRWCYYYFLTMPIINTVAFKLSEYPVTDLVIDHEDKEVKEKWFSFLTDQLQYKSFQVEFNLDYNVFGNALCSISFPFYKWLRCNSCGYREKAIKLKPHWQYTGNAFRLSCPKCHTTGEAQAKDFYVRNANGIKLIRWNVSDINIIYNQTNGKRLYFYNIPSNIRSDVVLGKKDIICETPQSYLQAIKEQKGILFTEDNMFHMARGSVSGMSDLGWGIPIVLPVLKNAFYLQVMKKAQETILVENIVPLRILYPQAASGTSDPFVTIDLQTWKEHFSQEIARWRYDQNYIPIVPLPIGQQVVGGDGKAMLMTAEMQQEIENIVVGMGVPKEFIFGGASWAGTNISMRMVENMFIHNIGRHHSLLRWVIRQTANYMQWTPVRGRFKPFKMADDIQRAALEFQVNAAGKLSDTSFMSRLDFDQEQENEIMEQEQASRINTFRKQQLAMAEIQGEAQLIQAKYQAKMQQVMMQAQQPQVTQGEPGDASQQSVPMQQAQPQGQEQQGAQPGMGSIPKQASSPISTNQRGGGVDLVMVAGQQAQMLSKQPVQLQEAYLANVQLQNPEFADMIRQALATIQSAPSAVDMRPLPEQRPPRRGSAIV